MASKSLLFILFFTTITMVMTVQMTDAQLIGEILNITGVVPCSLNDTSGVVDADVPPFSNATVQLQCGSDVLASTTTDITGLFSILLNAITIPATLLSDCNLVVMTPLSSCDASLPTTGSLVSPLQGFNILEGFLTITNIAFQFLPGA